MGTKVDKNDSLKVKKSGSKVAQVKVTSATKRDKSEKKKASFICMPP